MAGDEEVSKWSSFSEAMSAAEEEACEESGDAVEEIRLSLGVLPGEDAELEEELEMALDQPDFDLSDWQ
jgi:hypothetical protein